MSNYEKKKKKKKTGANTAKGLATLAENARKLDPTAWTKNPEAVEAITIARQLRSTTHGMYAAIPIICKAEACPYANSCPLVEMGKAPYAEKCPIEIAAIEDLFERYADQFEIDLENRKASETVDLMMIKDLVDADVAMLRVDNKMAWDADYIVSNTIGVTDDGEALTRQELHPLTEYKEKLINRKNKTYQLLNSTRKDKEGTKLNLTADPSVQAAEMLKVKRDMDRLAEDEEEQKKKYYESMKIGNKNQNEIIDVEPLDFEEEEDK